MEADNINSSLTKRSGYIPANQYFVFLNEVVLIKSNISRINRGTT